MLIFKFLQQELFKINRNSHKFLQNILFFLISCVIFLLLAKSQINQEYLVIIISFSLIFSLIFSNSDFLHQDFYDGTIEQIILLCENFETYIIAKSFANWFFYALPIIFSSYFLIFLLGFDKNFALKFAFLSFFASISINFICVFCASLNLSSNKSSMIAIFILPLIIPILLILISGLQNQQFAKSLEILIALAILSVIISVFAVAKIVKILID